MMKPILVIIGSSRDVDRWMSEHEEVRKTHDWRGVHFDSHLLGYHDVEYVDLASYGGQISRTALDHFKSFNREFIV